MRNRTFFLLLGAMVVITGAFNYVVSLVNFPLWVSLTLYTLSFVVVAFWVLFFGELMDRWQRHRKNVKRLLDEDKAKTDKRNYLQKRQSDFIDYNLSERLVDFELVKEEIELIRESLLNSIDYEENSIVNKQEIIEGNKQLLNELNGVVD